MKTMKRGAHTETLTYAVYVDILFPPQSTQVLLGVCHHQCDWKPFTQIESDLGALKDTPSSYSTSRIWGSLVAKEVFP